MVVLLPEGSHKCGKFLCRVILWIGFSEPLAVSALAACVVGEDQLSEAFDEEDPTFILYLVMACFVGALPVVVGAFSSFSPREDLSV